MNLNGDEAVGTVVATEAGMAVVGITEVATEEVGTEVFKMLVGKAGDDVVFVNIKSFKEKTYFYIVLYNLAEPYLVDPHLVAIVSKFPVWSTPEFWPTPIWSDRVLVDIVFWSTCFGRHFGLVEPHLVDKLADILLYY